MTYLGACSVSLNVPVFDLFCPVCKEAKDYCDAEDFTLQTNGYITELELCRNMVLQSQHAHALFNQQHKVMVDAYLDRAVVALVAYSSGARAPRGGTRRMRAVSRLLIV